MDNFYYAKDLAQAVIKKIPAAELGISADALTYLLEVAYGASLKVEEGQKIVASLCCINPDDPDPSPPKLLSATRWKFFRLTQEVELTASNLAKIAKSTDPRNSSLSVYPDQDGRWFIWGIIDQADASTKFLEGETEGGFSPPGQVAVVIESPGALSVRREFSSVASLRPNLLVSEFYEVFERGPVYELISNFVNRHIKLAQKSGINIPTSYIPYFERRWKTALTRTLIIARSFNHGGTFLILPDASMEHLNAKYEIAYDRLGTNLPDIVKAGRKLDIIDAKFYGKNKMAECIAISKHINILRAEGTFLDLQDSISASIKALASMSRVDGAVALDNSLSVRAFGVEITAKIDPPTLCLAGDELGSENLLKLIDIEHYGTRHRSVFRLCHARPGTLAFVISQDGDVRAVCAVGSKIMVWDNVQLHQTM